LVRHRQMELVGQLHDAVVEGPLRGGSPSRIPRWRYSRVRDIRAGIDKESVKHLVRRHLPGAINYAASRVMKNTRLNAKGG
jgi:hypothetical protein